MNTIQYVKMPAFKCEKCYKIFSLKTDLDRHHNKKNPCTEVEQIINEKAKEIAETTTKNNDDVTKVKKFLDFCHNTLRDKEGIVGMKALSNIAMLLFLRFVNNSVKNGNIDLLNIEKYRKEEGTDKEEKFQKYKKYIKYCLFENIVENGKIKVAIDELIFIIEYVFKHVLWYHPLTKKIFADEFPSIKNEVTYEQILKQMDKISWDDIDIDVKGTAYEHFLKSEMGGGDLGQFFTKREIVDYMIDTIKPHIKETSTFIDPFMGTGGFITHMFNEIRNLHIKKKIPFTDEIKNKMTNGIERNPQTCLLALNNMLLNMDMFPTNIKCDDSFRNYINEKYDFVLTNPPFGIKGLMYDNESMFPEIINGITKKQYLPHKSNDAICLALQMIPYILKKNGICAIVVPDGKQITSEKEKSIVAIRKMLIENNNLFQVTILPAGCFLPYTNVACCVLFFRKGEKTQNIKFVKLSEKYKNEKMLCNVDIKKIIKKNYSLNYKIYIEVENKYTGIEYNLLESLCDIVYGTRIVKKDSNTGIYPVYGGGDITFYTDNYNRDGMSCLISRFGMSENCVRFATGKLWLNDSGMTLSVKNDIIFQKYLDYYLLVNNKIIYELGKGTAQKNLSIDEFKKMQIPVPPIPVQNLIVQELDSMYKQKESLQNANNEMNNYRKVQFEMLLSKCKDVKNEKLGNISSIDNGKRIVKDAVPTGNFPVLGGGGITSFYTNEYTREGKTCKISREGMSLHNCVMLLNEKYYLNSQAFTTKSSVDYLKNEFLWYFLDLNKDKVFDCGIGAAQRAIKIEMYKELVIILPSLKDQELIVQQMEKYDELVKLQQAQIEEIDTTIKARFEFHLEKCKETKPTEVKEIEEIQEDKLSNDSTTKKVSVKSKTVAKNKTEIEDLEAELEKESLKTTRPKDKINIDEESNKSSKSVKLFVQKNKKPEIEESKAKKEELCEIVIVGKVECINEGGNYYKFANGKKGELYAKTSNGKVILYKKPAIKKVETIEDELDEMEKELNNIPKTK